MASKIFEWEPIEDLPSDWQTLQRADLHALASVWLSKADQLRQSSAYDTFMTQLKRKIAIETGVIERLYSITSGITQTLIERGIDAIYIPHDSQSNESPTHTVAVIHDHEQALEYAFDFVKRDRSLSIQYIQDLHKLLTNNQSTVDAVDTLGSLVKRPLLRGEWKKLPNTAQRSEGEVHEYCPPEQTASQMDQLVAWHRQHIEKGIPPEIEAAWLHHRFTQIHPFQDGNGRVVRLLSTLVFLRAEWFPLVITRDDRSRYLEALEVADRGNLKLLVDLFSEAQINQMNNTIDLLETSLPQAPVDQMAIDYARRVHERIQTQRLIEQETIDKVTLQLVALSYNRFVKLAENLQNQLGQDLPTFRAVAKQSTPDTEDYYYKQIVKAAGHLHYWADLSKYKHWVHLQLTTDPNIQTGILLSFHSFGRNFRGTFACLACAYQRISDSDKDQPDIQNTEPLSFDPFRITLTENNTELHTRFSGWLEEILTSGFAYWVKYQG